MESKSDKEASPQIFTMMAKFFSEEGLGKVGEYFGVITKVGEGVINPLDEGYKALKAFSEEATGIKRGCKSRLPCAISIRGITPQLARCRWRSIREQALFCRS